MDRIRIAIADDDPGMRLLLRKLAQKAEGYELVGEAANGRELLELYEEQHPDVVIMDVEMPEMTGIECARAIQDQNPKTVLVFVTAHEEYMKNAFEVYAFDYMVKPFPVERAMTTLERIRQRLTQPVQQPVKVFTQKPNRLMLRHKEGLSIVNVKEIMLVQREERSTAVYTESGEKYVTSDALGDIEQRLPADIFFRTHKSYIVNINYIDTIEPYGRWTYIIKLRGTKLYALITHEKFEEIQSKFA
jgi:two-component system LytT family response regulator